MTDKNITIVANIWAKPGKQQKLKSELLKLISPTLAEEGCINYDLHQDNNNECLFLFYENWVNRELWQQHMNSTHLRAHQKATKDIVENIEVFEMTPLQ